MYRAGDGMASPSRLHREGRLCLHTTSQSASQTAPLVGEPLAKRRSFTECQSLPSIGATATTAASSGNREELLGPRPAGCERQRSRRWEPQPGQWHGKAVTERFDQGKTKAPHSKAAGRIDHAPRSAERTFPATARPGCWRYKMPQADGEGYKRVHFEPEKLRGFLF